ncbi:MULTISPECIES: HK97-gp10 family putative phage morphogenesis protein [Enterococcus]|uniref:HK97 gp10 family phage protein n=1 Tax=Enterococcus mundtii TaxID=53346 RepID=A0A848MX93_ENTMU|nr:HK97-gp10 family putative phage morphogenesis protein [Enterococcus mundtii]EYT95533.1 hypothetical protein AK89_07435 [Enterococcus mundtii CRL35]MCA6775056.1 HK97 gp10 family phage protein [Enterococcus mundtii]MDV7743655.1 HK97 gp10 family phage protein [Enterococcus mundtii]NMP58608.1 HK97 gp10 family phage protein [Enterococcus mundtii]BAO06356.1 head-tail joining protein [Enterococcus mundtii QU 25]
MTSGIEEILANIEKLQLNNKRLAREAVNEGAEIVANNLEKNTPYDDGGLSNDVHVSGFKGGAQGQIEKDIGYGKGTGWRVKYPDSGTINQRPQNFKEKTITESRDPVLSMYADKIKEGLKL